MGIYVNLYIMPDKIEPARWSEVYEETIILLKAGNAMGLKVEDLGFAKKMYYSRDFERNSDKKSKRHWSVSGDSKKRAESFEMYYDLNYYRSGDKKSVRCRNEILYDIGTDKNNHITVFNEKTQGYPYHYTILAAASLVESRFPHFALVTGNIDLGQAKKSVQWANSILKNKIDVPVSTDSDRLFLRLKKYFKKKELIHIFERFFMGDSDEFYSVVFKGMERDITIEWFRERLKDCNSPGQIGASHLMSYWLKKTEDMETLCKIACLDKDGPSFDPLEFVNSICSSFTAKEQSKGILDLFKRPEGAVDKVYTQFGRVFLDLYLTGKDAEWYMDKEKLILAFSSSFPELIDKIKEIVDLKIKTITEKDIKLQKQKIEALENIFTGVAEKPDFDDGEIFNYVKDYDSCDDMLKTGLKVMSFQIKGLKKSVVSGYLKYIKEITPDSIRKEIIKLIDKRRHILITEDGWNWIDKEKEMDMLWILLTLANIDEMELTFCNTRRAVFENRDLCFILLTLMNDKKIMKETGEWIEEYKNN